MQKWMLFINFKALSFEIPNRIDLSFRLIEVKIILRLLYEL